MFCKTLLTLGILLASSASCPLMAGSASADDIQPAMAVPAVPAAMEQPKGQAILESVLDELMQGKSDLGALEPTLRVNFMQRVGFLPSLSARLQSLGEVKSVTFAGMQKGAEIYDVRFANGNSTWAVGMASDGKIGLLRWKFS